MTAILVAVVVVLQMLGSFIHIGPVSISLVLIPIAVGAALLGAKTGALLGFAFSLVVLYATVTGADAGAFILWSANPVMTALTILVKGTGAGWLSGIVYRAIAPRSEMTAAVTAAVVCPVFNTGVFLLAMLTIFREVCTAWAGGTNVVVYALVGLAGVNFVVELIVNIVLAPTIIRVVHAAQKRA